MLTAQCNQIKTPYIRLKHTMDAYHLHQQILEGWRQLSRLPSGASVQNTFPTVPVYVKIDQHLVKVTGVEINDNQIVVVTE